MDAFKKIFLAGVGAVSLSKERAQAIIAELVSQGQVQEKEGRKLLDEMVKKANQVRGEVEKNVQGHVNAAYTKMNLATQQQLKKMEHRLHQLELELAKKVKTATVKPKTASKKKARG